MLVHLDQSQSEQLLQENPSVSADNDGGKAEALLPHWELQIPAWSGSGSCSGLSDPPDGRYPKCIHITDPQELMLAGFWNPVLLYYSIW